MEFVLTFTTRFKNKIVLRFSDYNEVIKEVFRLQASFGSDCEYTIEAKKEALQ